MQALQPKLEAMEAMWFRLHSISGADSPDDVVSHWEGEVYTLPVVLHMLSYLEMESYGRWWSQELMTVAGYVMSLLPRK